MDYQEARLCDEKREIEVSLTKDPSGLFGILISKRGARDCEIL